MSEAERLRVSDARRTSQPEAPPERARGLPRDVDEITSPCPRHVPPRRARLEALDVLPVDDRLTVNAHELVFRQAAEQRLEREVREVRASRRMNRDELSLDDRVTDFSRIEQDDAVPRGYGEPLAPRCRFGVSEAPSRVVRLLLEAVERFARARASSAFVRRIPSTGLSRKSTAPRSNAETAWSAWAVQKMT